MCRWIAYSGPPIYPEVLLLQPENSLINQSLSARYSITPTNADGCGFGWYGEREEPGLFRDVLPAWNDQNLISIARQVKTSLFFAHVRAATFGPIQRSNCHPFAFERWMFMHNGQIGDYEAVRRDLESMVDPSYYNVRLGTTDSETIFLLLLSDGLTEEPLSAFSRTVGRVEEVMQSHGITSPLRLTAAATDGESIYAVRYASDDRAPTLYIGHSSPDGKANKSGPAVMVLSEPLDSDASDWREVEMSQFVTACDGAYRMEPFRPIQ
ncbi:MAG: class II glutamine amidotransferase [Pseudomonadota bacterium]|nr:class II glutamine amidotransferase [Pseudomonadota bacterium]